MMRILSYLSCVILAAAPLVSANAADELPAEVRRALAHRNLPSDSLSIYIEELASGNTVLAWREDVAKNPASVMKMVTTLAALELLGPSWRWQTEVHFNGDVTDGELNGDILLKGYGDPFMVTERFWQLLRQVRYSGVDKISGDLLLDDSYFDVGVHDPAAFDRAPLRAYNVGPNALLTNFKVVRYLFKPDLANGKVEFNMDPALDELKVVNRLRSTPGSCRGYQRGITITMNEALDEVTFSGRFPQGCEIYGMDRTALSHNEFTHALFKSLWQESGGEFDGDWQNVVVDEESEPVLVFNSMPLTEVIARVNKHSNNVMARQILFTLGAELRAVPGTEEAGRDVIMQWLSENGVAPSTVEIKNGAGLSRDVRINAKTLVEILNIGYRSPYMAEFMSSLSLSGHDGTLRRRLKSPQLNGRAHMKTGSLDDVTAVAGYFQSDSGMRYAVSILQNYRDVHRGPGDEVQAAVLDWLNRQ